MVTFVDTSAWYALLDEDDDNHASAVQRWRRLLEDDDVITHTYVVVESSALLQRRLGLPAAARFHRSLLAVANLVPIDARTHDRAVERWLNGATRQLSLVDVTSFVAMEDRGIDVAFAYDRRFAAEGFRTYA